MLLGEAAGFRVGRDEVVEVARRRAVDRGERLLDRTGDAEERQAALEECGDGDLVRGVVGARDRCRLARPRRARGRASGTSRVSGAWNSSVSPPARSSGATGVSARSGYVSAYEIGTRMSGYPRCASAAPSR